MIFEEKADYEVSISSDLKSNVFVYFLLQGKEVVYIGQTTKGIIRPISHVNDKEFDSIKIMYCERENLGELEHDYILKYNPKYNKSRVMRTRSVNTYEEYMIEHWDKKISRCSL